METESTENFESFDDNGVWADEAESSEANSDDWSKPDESQESNDEVKDDLKVLKDSKTDSEGKVIKEDQDSEKEDESEEEDKEEESEEDESEEEEESEDEEESEEEEKKPEDKKPKSKLRLRMGDELYNIDSNATLPVKIDGKLEDVPIQELVNNYSGKTAWDRKFTEIGKEKKAIEFEKAQVESQKKVLTQHIEKAIAPLKDKDGNPLDSLLYLVELSGEDPYNAYRRIMESNLEELSSLMDMTETERELYFHKKKDELHSSVARKRQEAQMKQQTFNQVVEKVDKLRQAYNVSEEDFVNASEELESIYAEAKLDVNSITEEQIVDYASLKPHLTTVKKLVAEYEDNISEEKYGEVVSTLAGYLRDGKADVKAIQQILKRNFSVEEDVKELNTKVYQKQKAKKPSKKVDIEDSGIESFDDWA